MTENILQIFAKDPIPYQVKTRLIPELGAEGAADFQAQLIRLCLKKFISSFSVQLWCAPTEKTVFFQQCQADFTISLHKQQGGDLGVRMANALAYSSSPTVLIGTDCPNLQLSDIKLAFSKLQNNDVVITPAEDGGYVLIGMRQAIPEIFTNIPWGTSQVFELTLKKFRQLKLRWHELPKQWDIDHPEDLARWQTHGIQNVSFERDHI